MNYKIDPEDEFLMMQEFFLSGGNVDSMPAELLRIRKIWMRADELVRKYPYYNNEKIANQLISDLPEYNLCLSTAKKHVTYAKKYFDLVESESPATHRRILSSILYKQIKKLQELQNVQGTKAHHIAKVIEGLVNRIASINHLYDKEVKDDEPTGDIVVVLSEKDFDFEDIETISDKELYKIIDQIAGAVEITPAEKQKIIDKDVKGKLI
jgi:hypothetical protein